MSDQIELTFGDPIPVSKSRICDYLSVFKSFNGKYYIPPIDLYGMASMRQACAHHGSAIVARRNYLLNAVKSAPLKMRDFSAVAMDFFTFGNCYMQKVETWSGRILALNHVPAMRVRKMIDGRYLYLNDDYTEIEFKPGEIIHVAEYDPIQNIYGMPDWLGGLHSAMLAEEATLFRRKYYINGAHLGNILLLTDANLSDEAVRVIRDNMKQGKGIGNFRSMVIHAPNANADSVKLIPFGDISNKDEFLNIKNVTAEDVLAAHRIPPVLMGVVPKNSSGFGSIESAKAVYISTETAAVARLFEELNDLRLKTKFEFNTETKEV